MFVRIILCDGTVLLQGNAVTIPRKGEQLLFQGEDGVITQHDVEEIRYLFPKNTVIIQVGSSHVFQKDFNKYVIGE